VAKTWLFFAFSGSNDPLFGKKMGKIRGFSLLMSKLVKNSSY
jgi:hypothetical protein